MTTFFLIRHGVHDLVGQLLAGRAPGIHLNVAGKMQAESLAERLAESSIEALFCSPRERARETAWPIARRLGLTIQTLEELDEVNFGGWTRRGFDELAGDLLWQRFNRRRSVTRAPGGESMLEVKERAINGLERICAWYPGASVAIISHGDVIKAAIAHFLGSPLDLITRLEISPGSVSIVTLGEGDPHIRLLNEITAAEP